MFRVNRKRLITTFVNLVKIPSPSWQEKKVIDYIIRKLKGIGVQYKKYKCGESYNILVRINGDKSRHPILFSCHMDTVIPCEYIKPIVTEVKISSDGNTILGADDKAAVAAFLEAIYTIKENNMPHGRLEFLFTCAEEIGLHGIKGFDLSILNSRYAFVFDSSGTIGKIIVKSPYHSIMEFTITGKAAHAGIEPERGISAIKVLAEIITKIPQGRIDDETTVNTGIITGGMATNIVAEQAYCKLESRSISKKKLQSIESAIVRIIKSEAKRFGVKAVISKNLEYGGFSIGLNNEIIKILEKAFSKLKIKPIFESSGGGSDTNILNKSGIRAINLSIGMMNVHTTKEYIKVKDLINGSRLVLSIIDSV